ncbi:hypothetical protein ACHWQZ_G005755 [Mnemiopsis leidyi]
MKWTPVLWPELFRTLMIVSTVIHTVSSQQQSSAYTDNLFQLADSLGNSIKNQQRGLLLYNGYTVCVNNFNMAAAHAVCKLMGYTDAKSATYGDIWKIQKEFKVFPQSLSCSHSDWSACTFKNGGNNCNDHSKDVFVTCAGERSYFSLVNQFGSQTSGQQQFLLLYNGGTVCGDHFSDNAAHAACKDMGYHHGAETWRRDYSSWPVGLSKFKSKYTVSLDEIRCTKGDWKSCSYSTSRNCDYGRVVYLSCKQYDNVPTLLSILQQILQYQVTDTILAVIILKVIAYFIPDNDQIATLTKEKAAAEARVKKLQDRVEELIEKKEVAKARARKLYDKVLKLMEDKSAANARNKKLQAEITELKQERVFRKTRYFSVSSGDEYHNAEC